MPLYVQETLFSVGLQALNNRIEESLIDQLFDSIEKRLTMLEMLKDLKRINITVLFVVR